MADNEAPRLAWRPWTLALAGTVALLSMVLLLIADGLAVVMASWDNVQPGRGWIRAAAVGHGVLLACAIALIVIGSVRPASRRIATIAAWVIVPLGIGLLVLFGRLASA